MAYESDLDLVEVSSQSNPPVCKIMSYDKYCFQQKKKNKENLKKTKTQSLKEIKIRPNIETHDYNFKLKNINKFLKDGHKVKITICFTGREISFMDKGIELLEKIKFDTSDNTGKISDDKIQGKFLSIIIEPKKGTVS